MSSDAYPLKSKLPEKRKQDIFDQFVFAATTEECLKVIPFFLLNRRKWAVRHHLLEHTPIAFRASQIALAVVCVERLKTFSRQGSVEHLHCFRTTRRLIHSITLIHQSRDDTKERIGWRQSVWTRFSRKYLFENILNPNSPS